jgi:hypothetical protein
MGILSLYNVRSLIQICLAVVPAVCFLPITFAFLFSIQSCLPQTAFRLEDLVFHYYWGTGKYYELRSSEPKQNGPREEDWWTAMCCVLLSCLCLYLLCLFPFWFCFICFCWGLFWFALGSFGLFSVCLGLDSGFGVGACASLFFVLFVCFSVQSQRSYWGLEDSDANSELATRR